MLHCMTRGFGVFTSVWEVERRPHADTSVSLVHSRMPAANETQCAFVMHVLLTPNCRCLFRAVDDVPISRIL